MKYIDIHFHYGDCRVFDLDCVKENELIAGLESKGVDAAILQACPGAEDYKAVHDDIYALTKKYPGKIYGLACVNPHLPIDRYKDEVRHYVTEYGFLGVKMHTLGHAINPLGKDATAIYEIAGELDIPVRSHTGLGAPWGQPSFCTPAAKKYPEIKFIIAHAGHTIYAAESLILGQECPNVYLDTTWVGICEMYGFVKHLGSKRMLFASDSSEGLANIDLERTKYELLDLSESELEDIFYKNAIEIFKIKDFK
jgi:predicted TIM-barrel fold metal-dependent hydrolase